MERVFLSFILLLLGPLGHAGILPYDLSSPDDLTNIQVGQTVHFDVFLPGISAETWDDTAIFNARALSSDTTLWEAPINTVFNPALSVSEVSTEGSVSWVHVDTPLTMLTDFVMSFDIVAAAAGAGTFTVSGADVFVSGVDDAFFTSADSLDFTIVAARVPEPGLLALTGVGLLLLLVRRRRSA